MAQEAATPLRLAEKGQSISLVVWLRILGHLASCWTIRFVCVHSSRPKNPGSQQIPSVYSGELKWDPSADNDISSYYSSTNFRLSFLPVTHISRSINSRGRPRITWPFAQAQVSVRDARHNPRVMVVENRLPAPTKPGAEVQSHTCSVLLPHSWITCINPKAVYFATIST